MINHSSVQNGEGGVFDRPLHLSGILDKAADELSHTLIGYNWNDRSRCNCGVVAQVIMETSAPKLQKLLPPIYQDGIFYPTWSAMTGKYCSTTGLSQNEVFRRLFAAGLRHGDFAHLEEISNPEILKRMGPYRVDGRPVSCSRKSDVVAYLRAWAMGIEEFHDTAPISVARETANA